MSSVNVSELFFDGIYLQKSSSLTYDQILLDFETKEPYDRVFIVEPAHAIENGDISFL
jgi:hypothetical protein